MKRLILLALMPILLLSQTPVSISPFPATVEPAKIFFYDGSGNLTHICTTRPSGPWNNNSVPITFSWATTGSTLTSIVDSSNTSTVTTSTAHGLRVGNSITVAGVAADTDLNGTYVIQTVPSTTTFTITTASVTDTTYNAAGISVTTAAARSTVAIWAVEKLTYNGSNQLTATGWANGAPTYVNICDNYATLSYR